MVDAMVAAVPETVRRAVETLVADMPDAAAVDFILAGWKVKIDQAEITRRAEEQHTAARNEAAGAKKGLAKQRQTTDPAGRHWKPRYTGKLNPAVFVPQYGTIPKYVLPLIRHMNRIDRGTVLAAAYRVDREGDFVMQRGRLKRWLGTTRRRAGESLERHRRAGVIAIKHQGARGQATVWRFVTVAEHDPARAVAVYRASRTRATQQVEAVRV